MHCRRRLPHDSEWLEDLVESLSPELELERESVNRQLHTAMETLPARARETLRLHFAEDMTHPEIANTMGLTRKIVKRDTARAYAVLRSRLCRDAMGIHEQYLIGKILRQRRAQGSRCLKRRH